MASILDSHSIWIYSIKSFSPLFHSKSIATSSSSSYTIFQCTRTIPNHIHIFHDEYCYAECAPRIQSKNRIGWEESMKRYRQLKQHPVRSHDMRKSTFWKIWSILNNAYIYMNNKLYIFLHSLINICCGGAQSVWDVNFALIGAKHSLSEFFVHLVISTLRLKCVEYKHKQEQNTSKSNKMEKKTKYELLIFNPCTCSINNTVYFTVLSRFTRLHVVHIYSIETKFFASLNMWICIYAFLSHRFRNGFEVYIYIYHKHKTNM